MEVLSEGAKNLGLYPSSRHLALFERYYQELTAWNQRFNLTAITGYQQVQRRHFLDSLSCLVAFPRTSDVDTIPNAVPLQMIARPLWLLDVGSGAGFPGLPIKLMLPDAKLTLIEATQKKVTFLKHMVQVLGVADVEVLHARSEDVAHLPEHRERYDVVVARAVAHLSVVAEYCLPFCCLGGRVIAPKGEGASAEAREAEMALETLGGSLVAIKPVVLPDWDTERYLVVVDKVAPSPDKYPRRAGMPSKRPLQ